MPVTFAEIIYTSNPYDTPEILSHKLPHYSHDPISLNPNMEEIYSELSQYPYGFNPDLTLDPLNLNMKEVYDGSLPRHILRLNSGEFSYLDNWNIINVNKSQRHNFISKYFPDRINLYDSYKHEEERDNLFVYLWLYMNGGVYVSSLYEIIKPLDDVLSNKSDLYFIHLIILNLNSM